MIANQIRRIGIVILVAFVAIFLQLNYLQIVAAERITSHDANIRRLLAEHAIKRGDIVTSDGVRVAVSKPASGRLKFARTYPHGDLYGHITGYYSVFFGTDRIERTFNDQLLGDSGVITVQDIQDRFLGSGEQGDDVILTIDSALQEAARELLGDQQGAVVALDPQSGAVRALWSNPSFDPNPIAAHDPDVARPAWDAIQDPDGPLLNRATSRSYPPGSTLKVITTAAALEEGISPDDRFDDPVELDLPLTDRVLKNFTQRSCTGSGEITLFDALRVSCDTTFGRLGLRIPGAIFAVAEAFGFNVSIPFDIATRASTFPDIPDEDEPLRAYAAIGQGDVSATPLQMALVAAGIANGGEVPRPRLVHEVIDPAGSIVESYDYEPLGRALPSDIAQSVTEMMVAVVESGTGTAAQVPGVEVAGKTGTAQTVEGQDPHAWFIAFAPARDPQLAIAVIVENGGSVGSEATGGALAAPIARALFELDRGIRGW